MRQTKKTSLVIQKWIMLLTLILLGISTFSCVDGTTPNSSSSPTVKSTLSPTTIPAISPPAQTKISSLLQLQISLRKEQLASPTLERLSQMQAQGMNVTNISVQRIYIYLNQNLTSSQANDLQAWGIILYPDSWIPPVGNHPTGFILADMPEDALDTLAAKDYVVRLDTAETQSQPVRP